MGAIAADTVFRRVELPGSRIQDEMVFFDQTAGKYYATGQVGADIWEFLNAPKSFTDICDHLLSIYDVDRTVCELQTRSFLTQMLDAGIVTDAHQDKE